MLVILGVGLLLPPRYRLFPDAIAGWASASLFGAAFVLETLTFIADYGEHPRVAWMLTLMQISLISALVAATLAHLLRLLVAGGSGVHGIMLLSSGLHIWISNMLVFGLWFWLLDRGGPHARSSGLNERVEFLFPEMTAGEVANPAWSPNIVEYMYLSFTNSTAFSPTDTLPLSKRVRVLMAVESSMSLLTVALVASRAVNILQ